MGILKGWNRTTATDALYAWNTLAFEKQASVKGMFPHECASGQLKL
jgi:hypothetical protein